MAQSAILENAGQKKIFLPHIGKMLKAVLPDDKTPEEIYNENIVKLKELKECASAFNAEISCRKARGFRK